MSLLRWLSALLLALALMAGAAWWLQVQSAGQLRGEVALLRDENRELARLREENLRLAARQPTAAQLAALRADHVAVAQLKSQIEALREKTIPPSRAVSALEVKDVDTAAPASAEARALFQFPEKGWKNVGRATPGATVETALWAATGGDLDALTTTFVIEDGARTKAAAMFSVLPEAARAQYGTPEKLIAALFVAKDLPVSVKLGGVVTGADSTKLLLRVQSTGGAVRDAAITLRSDADGWRVVVSEGDVGKYAAMLAGAAKSDASGK
jgi:hypothetical protein